MSSTTPSNLKWSLFAGVLALLALLGYSSCGGSKDFDMTQIAPGTCHEFTDPKMFDLSELSDGWNKPFVYTCVSPRDSGKAGVWVLIPLNDHKAVPVITGGVITYNLTNDGSGRKVMICFYEFADEQNVEVKTMEGGEYGKTVVVTADKDTEQPISGGGSVPFSGFASARPCLVVVTGGHTSGTVTADGVDFTWSSETGFIAPSMEFGHMPFPTEYSASTRGTVPVRTVKVASR